MTEKKKKYYSDIIIAINFIQDFLNETISFEKYSLDYKTQSAVERQLVIIGEAINNLKKIGEEDLNNVQQIISFRNRLVHAYDSIDNSIVWLIVKKHIPLLKEEIEKKNS